MPRGKTGPTVPWPALEHCTPLGTLIVEWMWAQRPPTPVSVLAARVGVDRSTLVNWLTTDRQPQPLQLLLLSQVTELPLTGLASAADVPLERVLKQRAVLFDYVSWESGRYDRFSDEERSFLLARLMEVCSTPTGATGADETPDASDDTANMRANDDAADQDGVNGARRHS
jgi:transcriptional regulator with XRE-family HTH domain